MSILQRYGNEDETKLQEVEKTVSNKWRWDWLEKTVVVDPGKICPKLNWKKGPLTLIAKDTFRKVDLAGKAICTVCQADGYVTYGSSGVKILVDHMKTKKHVSRVAMELENTRLPGTKESSSDVYGAPAAYHDAPSSSRVAPKTSVHVLDRVANMEAMLVGFLAEHSLSFSMSQRIIDLAKELCKDRPALQKLNMHRTTASYKLIYGLGKTVHEQLTEKLRTTPFSMNMDESTSSNTKHVYTVLVSYYNSDSNEIAVEHLGSIDVPSCTSKNLFRETKKLIEGNNIPWKKLIAMLSDSASTMRGTVTGLETRIRSSVAPHLLDIDGESCHHMHNIVKNFVKYFDNFLEHLFRDISTEFKFSADSLHHLKEVAFHLGIKFRKPDNFIMARWLSVYDNSVEFHHMLDAHKILFSAYEKANIEVQVKHCEKEIKKRSTTPKSTGKTVNELTGQKEKSEKNLKKEKSSLLRKEEKRKTTEALVLKKHKTSEASKAVLSDLKDGLVYKYKNSTTKKGKERKTRVINKLNQPKQYTLLTSLYQSVLPLFKSYVMLFQSEKPLIHKVYYKQVSCVRTFFSYFVKPDVLVKCKKGQQLLDLELKKENLLPKELIFIGKTAKELVDKLGSEHVDVVNFLDKTAKAYLNCGIYIQKKLPLESKMLKSFAAIDPLFVTSPNQLILKRLLSLPKTVLNILTEEEEQQFEQEVRSLLVDPLLPPAMDDDGKKEVDCLTWWSLISKTYPSVFKMVTAVLSIFHGPRVESSFNIMGDVIDKKSGRINMKTYSAVQDVKYALQARQPSAKNRSINEFCRKDRLYSPVNPTLANNMRRAYSFYNADLDKKEEEKKKKQEEFQVKKDSTTRKMLKDSNATDAEEARIQHKKILDSAYNPKRKLPAEDNQPTKAKKSKRVETEVDEAEEDEVQVVTKKSVPSKRFGKKKQGTVDSFFTKN